MTISTHRLALMLADATTLGLAGLLVASLLSLAACVWMMTRDRMWLKDLGQSAARLAQGDLTTPIHSSGPPPVVALAQTLNQMARQLDGHLSEVVSQRNKLGTILSSMDEGVLALDADLRIISLNRAASAMLGLDPTKAIDQPFHQLVDEPALREFLQRPMEDGQGAQGEFLLTPRPAGNNPPQIDGGQAAALPTEPRVIEAQSALLRDATGGQMGTVLVLHDVTRLRQLELIRQDFVSNVSHEIRTPISAIKAAAETMSSELALPPDGPMIDMGMMTRFTGIISRQSERLHAIVEDLLSLARIEQGKREDAIEVEAAPVSPIIASAVEACQSKADHKNISIRTSCQTGLQAQVNRVLIEQAMINLIDNAIKYSPEATRVDITARQTDAEVMIDVADQGRGIEARHLPRLFERFYRTDKARSRAVGGTGLGLSIVKHIAEAQGGRVSVLSHPGRGSTFTLIVPPVRLNP